MTDHMPPIIQVNDPSLDSAAIAARVQQQVADRRAQGLYGPDLGTLGPESLRPDRLGSAQGPAPVVYPGLYESLAELIAKSYLDEPDFVSNAPLVGPLIVSVRRLWNWISTRWYVLPILRAQSDVNAHTARLVSDLAQWHELDARRLHQLESRITELEARLAGLEAEAKP